MQNQSDLDLEQVLFHALKACRLGREVLLKYYGKLEQIEEKFQAGLVSEADRESEQVIFSYLKNYMPNSEFLGEESDYLSTKPLPQNLEALTAKTQGLSPGNIYRWILDPLDGTTNYVHRFPIFCISLALEVNSKIQVAVIDVPVLGETYTAIAGRGAFVNGKRMSASTNKNLKDTLLATGFFGDIDDQLQRQLKIFTKIVSSCRGVRRAGAAAYDLCMVARGVFDGFWEEGLKSWDLAAGSLLVTEAGGLVSNYNSKETSSFSVYNNSIIAAGPGIMSELKEIIQKSI